MNRLIKALTTITSWMERMNISYMVFGGIANSIYGNPRQTFDVDIKHCKDLSDFLNNSGIYDRIKKYENEE